MEKSYNTSIKTHDYAVGDDVWLRKKNFKGGESIKLAPRRTGPWTIVEVKADGRNFLIRSRNGKRCVVHHDRLTQVVRHPNVIDVDPTAVVPADSDSSEEYKTASEGGDSDSDTNVNEGGGGVRPYPLRDRTQKEIPGAVRLNPYYSSSSSDGEGE